MKERPILFSGSMVRALLDGSKTQTRRAVKAQPSPDHKWAGWCISSTCSADEGKATWARGDGPLMVDAHRVRCPYGQPGDRLWVRECFSRLESFDFFNPEVPDDVPDFWFWADGNPEWGNWTRPKPSIHMPRAAARIVLEITEVRVERLQEISGADCIAEGIGRTAHDFWSLYGQHSTEGTYSPRASYRALWGSLNGPSAWDANPWVWVVSFKRTTP